MYLTRFRFNPARRGARKLLASPHAMHAAVRAGFAEPDDHQRGEARTLWRLDANGPGTVYLYLYLVSPGRPDLTHLVEQAGWPTTDTWVVRDYDTLLHSLRVGQRWAFRLTANPTHSGRRSPEAKETQRFGRLRQEEQAGWLLDRTARHGFAVPPQHNGLPNLSVSHRQTLTFKRGMAAVTLVTATYDGILEITDADAFRRALTSGIGPAKGYGCGLLTLAPA